MLRVSAVIITLNEAENLPRCLESIRGLVEEIVVVDSLSTDETVAIAEAAGARVVLQKFLGHREQKAFAIEQASNDYVLSLDADEALSAELQQSIRRVKNDWTHDGYYVNRLNRLNGVWIHHGGWYPDRKMRLFDRRKYIMGGTNPHDRFDPTPAARTTRLEGDLLHYTNDDLTAGSLRLINLVPSPRKSFYEEGKRGSWWRVIVKPTGRFVSEYLLKSGWRDGYYGYYIAKTSAQYVWLREVKLLGLS